MNTSGSTKTVSDARLQDLINLYDGQAFRGDTVLALEELQRLRHYVATCGGTDNDGRCPMHHLAGLAPEPKCGSCGEVIRPDPLTGTTCACACKQPDEPVDDEQWQRSMEDAVRFRFFFDPHRGETSKAILGLTMKALTPPYPSVDAWRAAIDADRLGLTKAAPAVEPAGTASFNVTRYKVVQDKGEYCLKGCPDGDLVDFSAYAALLNGCTTPTKGASDVQD